MWENHNEMGSWVLVYSPVVVYKRTARCPYGHDCQHETQYLHQEGDKTSGGQAEPGMEPCKDEGPNDACEPCQATGHTQQGLGDTLAVHVTWWEEEMNTCSVVPL